MNSEQSESEGSNGHMDGETQDTPKVGLMTEPVSLQSAGSFCIEGQSLPFWNLWRMKWHTHISQRRESQQLESLRRLLLKHMIGFPMSELPDMDDWDDDDEEEIYE